MIRARNCDTKRIPAGYTLIEVLLVLSLVSSLLGGTIGLMSIVQKSDKNSKQSFVIRQELRRFADDIRRDIHAANDVSIDESILTLSRASSEQSIIYRVDSKTNVSRVILNADESSAARDEYTIGRDAVMQIESLGDGNLVQWTITESDRPNLPIRIITATRIEP